MTCEKEGRILFSLYLHVPFCTVKCGYCSFYSCPSDEGLTDEWLRALSREAGYLKAIWGGRVPLRTLYIGGGTPSVLDLVSWRRLFHILEGAFDLSGLLEATVEANPCSLAQGHLELWRESFLTRISMGVQSLQNDELKWLGRLHDAETAKRAIGKAQDFGFNVSADLIFGHPLQTLRSWHDSLRQLLFLGLEHISTYQLTLEPDTPLGNKNPTLPEGYPFYRFAQGYLSHKGMEQYEIASFAFPGKECRHNLAYWRQENVLALGPAAWGYLDGFRYGNTPSLEEYILLTRSQPPIVEAERLNGGARGIEAAILALRMKEGMDEASFSARFGQKLCGKILCALKEMPSRLVRFEEGRVHLSPAGMRVGNAIWTELLGLSD